ncbi:hypothetical protein KSS87_011103, partial [Heliosperma pusillum]
MKMKRGNVIMNRRVYIWVKSDWEVSHLKLSQIKISVKK